VCHFNSHNTAKIPGVRRKSMNMNFLELFKGYRKAIRLKAIVTA
jgi:hypothetical protein